MNKRRRIVADRLKALTQGGFMQALRNYPTKHKLDIDRIEYETPDFISTHATPQFLAEALDRNFQGLDFMDGVKYPELVAPELETTVPVLAVKSRVTDVNTLARDTVAAVKQELVKSANLFAQLHIMKHEETREWPEWYQQHYDAALRKVICWERECAERVDHFAGFPEELSGEDKCDLFLGRILAVAGRAEELEVLRREKGWSEEEMEGMLAEVEAREQKEVTQKTDLLKTINAAKEGFDQVLDALAPGEAGAQALGEKSTLKDHLSPNTAQKQQDFSKSVMQTNDKGESSFSWTDAQEIYNSAEVPDFTNESKLAREKEDQDELIKTLESLNAVDALGHLSKAPPPIPTNQDLSRFEELAIQKGYANRESLPQFTRILSWDALNAGHAKGFETDQMKGDDEILIHIQNLNYHSAPVSIKVGFALNDYEEFFELIPSYGDILLHLKNPGKLYRYLSVDSQADSYLVLIEVYSRRKYADN